MSYPDLVLGLMEVEEGVVNSALLNLKHRRGNYGVAILAEVEGREGKCFRIAIGGIEKRRANPDMNFGV
jgi:hypothetical protein